MGMGTSRVYDSKLLRLCKERKELIKAIVNCRYDLVSTHVMYFQSFLDVGNALIKFVEEDLLIVTDSSDENSHLKFSSINSESDLESLSDYVHDCLHILSDSKPSPSSLNSKEEAQLSRIQKQPIPMQVQDFPNITSSIQTGFPQHSIDTYIPIVDMSYPQHNNNNNITINNGDNNVPFDSWCDDRGQKGSVPSAAEAVDASSVRVIPPEAEESGRNYFNPFKVLFSNVYTYNSHYPVEKKIHGGTYDDGPDDLREVRETEGIPDLEYDTDQSMEEREASKQVKLKEDIKEDSCSRTEMDDYVEDKKKPETFEDYVKASSDSCGSTSMEEDHAMQGSESSKVDQWLTHDSECLGPIFSTNIRPRDLHQVVQEIRDAFVAAFTYGNDVSILLEAGKLPYQPKLKAFASCIRTQIVPSVVMSSQCHAYTMSGRSASKKMKITSAIPGNYEEDICKKFSDLSSTLEKLYMWEKKLYKEIKGQDKLRVIYDNEWKRLRDLDDRGAESIEIDRTQASIKSLLSEISVSVTAVSAISTRIRKLQDEELHSQVNELIDRLSRMWKLMTDCHHKQFQVITWVKTCVHIATVHVREISSLKATLKLEKETLKWAARFSDYIRTQKVFVKLLNKWLLCYISLELEGNPEGIASFSPSRIDAPQIFIVCNDWYNAIRNISEDEVYMTIHGFASSLHHLQEKAKEECRQRKKTNYVLKDFRKHFKYLQEGFGVHWNQDAAEFPESAIPLLGEHNENLVKMKTLVEQKARHEEAIKLVNDAASNCMSMGMFHIFQALERFCMENWKAYGTITVQRNVEANN